MKVSLITSPFKSSISIKPLTSVADDQPRSEAFEIIWLKNQPPPPEQLANYPPNFQGNCLYLLPPGKEYPVGWFGPAAGTLIRFHRDVLHYEVSEFTLEVYQLFTQQENFSVLMVEESAACPLDQLYQLLEEEYARGANFRVLRTLLKVLLLKLMEYPYPSSVDRDFDQKRVYQFLQLLEQHFKREKSVAFYADQLNITSKRLNQILKKKVRRTIRQCLHERLVAEAKHQLILSERTIKEIATDLGFDDHSYFSRFFKKMTGLTPETFHQRAQARIALTQAV